MQNNKEQMIWLGIHNRQRPIREVRKIQPIQESLDDISKRASHAISGYNSLDDSERLKSIVPNNEIEKQTDSYIHDLVKQKLQKNTKLDIGTTKHLLDIISHPELPTEMLKNKWQHFLYVHTPRTLQKHKNLDSIFLKPEELDSMSEGGFAPHSGRVFRHIGSGHYFELHHDGSISYKGDEQAPNKKQIVADKYSEDENIDGHSWRETANNLNLETNSQRFKTTEPFAEYTGDSLHVNSALHAKAKNIEITKEKHPLDYGMHESGLHLANSISEQISKFLPLVDRKDFHVYTGVHSSIDPEKSESGEFHAPSFTSTSLKPSVAAFFAQDKKDVAGRTVKDIFKVTIPQNFKNGVYIKPFSDHKDEEEFLIDKGQGYKVSPEPKHFVASNQIHRLWDASLILNKKTGENK